MEFLEKMKAMQSYILDFLDSEEDTENYDILTKFINLQKPQLDIPEYKSILNLISKIAENHHRCPFFFDKIQKIIIQFKKEILESFSNIEIFNIFKNNKRILLFLINKELLTFDSDILKAIKDNKIEDYFYTEINKLQKSKDIEMPELYEEKRQKGENDSYLCELIRNDDVENFIIYYTKKGFSLLKTIESSIYETNSFLLGKNPTLIEYSAFFGSIKILRFLFQNQVDLMKSLWIYSIHGKNPDIIHFLEENFDSSNYEAYEKKDIYRNYLKESIKCHHNDFALYFKNNFIDTIDINKNYYDNEICYGFQFHNFQFIPNEFNHQYYLFYAIEYDHLKLVEYYRSNEYSCDHNNYDIFNYLLKLPEIKIDSNCFYCCHKLTKLTIPSSITSIGDHAFCECISLNEIIIPSSVTSIGDYAFYGCEKLANITIPISVTSIGNYSFYECTLFTEIKIPESITNIGDFAFSNCINLNYIIIPSSVISIGDRFVSKCLKLNKIEIPSNVEKIGILDFQNFEILTEFTIPSSVKTINENAFDSCISLIKIVIPPSVTTIEFNAFHNCISLVDVTIPSTLKSIGFNSFSGCKKLKKIKINPMVQNFKQHVHIIPQMMTVQLLVLGDSTVGKSSIVKIYSRKGSKIIKPTIGFEYETSSVFYNGESVLLEFVDTPGSKKFIRQIRSFYGEIHGAIVVFNLTNPDTLSLAKQFLNEVKKASNSIPLVLLGNMSDLNHQISNEDIMEIQKQHNVKYFEVSAKSGFNIKNSFQYICNEVIKYIIKLEKKEILDLIDDNAQNDQIMKCKIC